MFCPNKQSMNLAKKRVIGIVTAVATLILVTIVFVNIGRDTSDYTKMAKKYFTAVESCNWDTVYSMVDIPSTEFLTIDQLKMAMSTQNVTEISQITAEKDAYSDVDETKKVRISYVSKAYSESQSISFEMIKIKNEKTMLFFDTYRVSPGNLVSKDFKIKVYKGAQVSIDGIVVDSVNYSTTDKNENADQYDFYSIDYLFTGVHTLKITNCNMEDYEEKVLVEYDEDSFSYTSPTVASSVLIELEKKAQDHYKRIISEAIAGKDFSFIQDMFVNDSVLRTTAKNSYTKFAAKLKDSSGYGFKSLTLSLLSSKSREDTVESDGYQAVCVDVSSNYSGEYFARTYSYIIHGYEETTTTKAGTTSATFYFRYQDGNWNVYKMSIATIYTY